MRVLQLGFQNWAKLYELDKDFEWLFNKLWYQEEKEKAAQNNNPNQKKHIKIKSYDVVLITGETNLSSEEWKELRKFTIPYQVLYLPEIEDKIDDSEKYFLKSMGAQKITEDPQTLISKLHVRYFSGQSGMRIFPKSIKLNERVVDSYEFNGNGELKLTLNTQKEWVNLGTYKTGIFIDPNKLINLWLTLKAQNFKVKMRVFIQNPGTDGSAEEQKIIDVSNFRMKEYCLPIKVEKYYRTATVALEVKGNGSLTIGILHSRWGRNGAGNFIAGGKRIVNPKTREDIAYYFNPADLKPPLNVYFSGAREAEGFEAYYMTSNLQAPVILFTDMRLSIGQFYEDQDGFMGKQIIKIIKDTLQKLGFDSSQLIMNGISMGTYAAIKYGAQLNAYAINVAKPLVSLGYIASRGALDRPNDFDTIFDIDDQVIGDLSKKKLAEFDQKFMNQFNQNDLSKTRLFVSYMKDDDYDNHAIHKLAQSPAVRKAIQFSAKGYAGRHNDDPTVNYWFIDRLHELMKEFGRK